MGQGISVFSDKTLMASVDKNSNMSFAKRMGAQTELQYKLFGARGHLRSELKGISYSDYKNLMHMASKQINLTPSFDPFHQLWLQVLQELQSIQDEFVPNSSDSNKNPFEALDSSKSKHESDEDRLVVPIPIPSLQAPAARYDNSGEQNFRGLINQSGYVSGKANGSIFFFHDCKFPWLK